MKREKGIALIMMLAMISLLAIVIMICAFVLSHEVNQDERHEITRQRMLQVKRSLIGRLADVSGGEDIISCGGFISDFGEPIDTPVNFIDRLLDEQDPAVGPDIWLDWHYEDALPNNYQFWAGYRVAAPNDGYYLKVPPAQPNSTTEFLDGWGFPIEVVFVGGAGGNTIDIISRGSDGQSDSGGEIGYEYDVTESFNWRRRITITNNTGFAADFRLIYPLRGAVTFEDHINTPMFPAPGSTFTFVANVPVGLRKIEVRDTVTSTLERTKMFCLSPSANAYLITID